MEKEALILLLVLLSGCSNSNREVACSYVLEDKAINLDIKAHYDDIYSINVRTSFIIPRSVMVDSEKYDFLCKQLDASYHFEDNELIREYSIAIDDKYSLDKTIKYLNTKRFYCE